MPKVWCYLKTNRRLITYLAFFQFAPDLVRTIVYCKADGTRHSALSTRHSALMYLPLAVLASNCNPQIVEWPGYGHEDMRVGVAAVELKSNGFWFFLFIFRIALAEHIGIGNGLLCNQRTHQWNQLNGWMVEWMNECWIRIWIIRFFILCCFARHLRIIQILQPEREREWKAKMCSC